MERRELLGIEKGGIEKGIAKGRREGIQEGRQEGKLEGIKKSGKNLLKEGAEISLVVKTTGLSKSEVEKLKRGFDN